MWNEIFKSIARQSAKDGTLPKPTSKLLVQVWPALVGSSIARLSSPVRLEDRTLYIEARNQTLVDEWRSSPIPLLRKLRRFSPWVIETLQIEYNPSAGVTTHVDPVAQAQEVEQAKQALPAESGTAPVDDHTDQAIDNQLRSLIESIDVQRKTRKE